MKEFGLSSNTPPFKVDRPSQKAVLWDRAYLASPSASARAEGKVFRMLDGATYALHSSGAFVRTKKDRRPVKARKAERQKRRAEIVSAGAQTQTIQL